MAGGIGSGWLYWLPHLTRIQLYCLALFWPEKGWIFVATVWTIHLNLACKYDIGFPVTQSGAGINHSWPVINGTRINRNPFAVPTCTIAPESLPQAFVKIATASSVAGRKAEYPFMANLGFMQDSTSRPESFQQTATYYCRYNTFWPSAFAVVSDAQNRLQVCMHMKSVALEVPVDRWSVHSE
jgi:hypothetical protein